MHLQCTSSAAKPTLAAVVTVVDSWTGERAGFLQAALRLSNDDFAERLGIATRTVAAWHSRPDIVPRPEVQQILDAALDRASAGERTRFSLLLNAQAGGADHNGPATPQSLYVAIAVVQRDDAVLLVHRRDGDRLSWQFPAGIVKPKASPEAVAVHETLAETGVHSAVRSPIGSRLHPVTDVYCVYFHCDYLTGEAENRDVVENTNVAWVPVADLMKFIPEESIYPPILDALRGAHD